MLNRRFFDPYANPPGMAAVKHLATDAMTPDVLICALRTLAVTSEVVID